MHKFYSGKVFIVTGGSSGIGKALAARLLQLGAGVILIARRQSLIDTAIAELENLRADTGQVLAAYSADIADRAQISRTMQDILDKYPVSGLINNAGIVCCDAIENLDDAQFEAMMQVNYFGLVWTTRAILPYFRSKRSGLIVNIASLGGVIGCYGYSAYGASKFAVVGFTDALRNEMSGTGIQVALVNPSDVDTPQFEEENKTKPAQTKALSGKIKLMKAETVADMILKDITRGKYYILPVRVMGKISYSLNRLTPRLFRWIIDSEVKKIKA